MTLQLYLHTATLLPVFQCFRDDAYPFGQNYHLLTGGILRLRAGVGVGKILPTPAPTPTPAKRSTPIGSNSGLDSVSAALIRRNPLILDLEPLALGAHSLLIWNPCLLHGGSIGSRSGAPACSRVPMTRSGPVGSLFRSPACSRGPKISCSGAPACSLLHWLLICRTR